ncbi:MAG: glycoside hydrolase family 3 protein [Anaerolineae bacterium]|nr:glycoside hydrolase family 3 protein [Anaerolineae bacterium]
MTYLNSSKEFLARSLSRREFLRLVGPGLPALALLAGCGPLSSSSAPSEITPFPTLSLATPSPTVTPLLPSEEMLTPDLEFKIGQMLMVGFRGLAIDGEHFIAQDIRERHLGGVVLFSYDVPTRQPVRNIESPAQVKTLIASLQSFSATPLLVAVDQEGGLISRLNEQYGFPATVSHQYLGEVNNLATTYQQATAMAQTLAGVGVNLNLAPVVDLCINPANPIIAKYERCFSADPAIVTVHACQFIQAHHAQGVRCTLKHFPGHGSSREDSHRGLVDVTETWSRVELQPYAQLIKASLADAMMTAHVFNTNLDPEYPATLSRAAITGLLRQELGYEGVVISDDMQMGAIVNYYGFETAIEQALGAGVDVLAFANNSVYEEDVASRAMAVIKGLVQAGAISASRIDESYQRIQRLKRCCK